MRGVQRGARIPAPAIPRAKRRRTWSASPTSRPTATKASSTNSSTQLQGTHGQRTVVRDRLGRVVEDIGDAGRPDQRPRHRAVDRLQGAVLRLAEAARCRAQHGARAGSVVVLDVRSRRGAGAGQLPELRPCQRRNLSGAQLRNRALTDIFEPGSTMKPFTVALAHGDQAASRRDAAINTAPGRITITGAHHPRRPPARRADGGRGDPEVEQRRHREDGDADGAARDVGDVRRRSASARSRSSTSRARSPAACGPTRPGARSSRRR